ncbi:methionyl-tRNA formyltransferase [Gammaproteobacteria bacterium]|nr:methionyl-tRNA formyltransferase [Gammaproteobacteria bacterium]
MKIIFAGSPQFSVPVLNELAAHHDICLVITQPDRPSGRGKKIHQSPIKLAATALGLPVSQPENIKDAAFIASLKDLNADIMIVSAYGQILPPSLLTLTHYHAWNIHASILPRWRGASPIEHAILYGDKVTGISIMKMEKGMDTGAVIHKEMITIGDKNQPELMQCLSNLAPKALLTGLDKICANQVAQPQDENHITHAKKILAVDFKIDWQQPAQYIEQQVRAFFPRTYCLLDGKRVRLLAVTVIKQSGTAGQISKSDDGLIVFCKHDAILIQTLQVEGKSATHWKDFYNGHQPILGQFFL